MIKSQRLISFRQRHVAAISYEVTLLNGDAPVVISSEIISQQPGLQKGEADPRQAKTSPEKCSGTALATRRSTGSFSPMEPSEPR